MVSNCGFSISFVANEEDSRTIANNLTNIDVGDCVSSLSISSAFAHMENGNRVFGGVETKASNNRPCMGTGFKITQMRYRRIFIL